MMQLIETAIGVVLIYLLLSLVATGLSELLMGRLQIKALILRRAIYEMLHDLSTPTASELKAAKGNEQAVYDARERDADRALQVFYQTPPIAALYTGPFDENAHWEPNQGVMLARIAHDLWPFGLGEAQPAVPGAGRWQRWWKSFRPIRSRWGELPRVGPSYIAPETFAEALLEMACPLWKSLAAESPAELRGQIAIGALPEPARSRLLALLDGCIRPEEELPERIAGWFNEVNDRAHGWFKRELSRLLLALGLILALALNADTLQMFERFNSDPMLRAQAVKMADKIAAGDEHSLPNLEQALGDSRNFLGWHCADPLVHSVFDGKSICKPEEPAGKTDSPTGTSTISLLMISKLLGLLITAGAISLGSPFWFDLLQKLVNLRTSLLPKPKAANDDREPADDAGKTGREKGPGGATPRAKPATATPATARPQIAPPDPPSAEDFQMEGAGFSLGRAQAMAHLCRLAYLDEPELSQKLKSLQLKGLAFSSPLSSGHDTQGFLAWNATNLFLCFRGSEAKVADWATNAQAQQSPFDNWGRVHLGFQGALVAAGLGAILQAHFAKIPANATLPLWIGGHSLGGALAVLAAAQLEVERQKAGAGVHAGPLMGVYTFGQPRVGDPSFVTAFDAHLPYRLHRFVNHRDPVPRVPLRAMGFAEQTRVHYFDGSGRLDGSGMDWTQRLERLMVTETSLRAAGSVILDDHGMAFYEHLVAEARKQG